MSDAGAIFVLETSTAGQMGPIGAWVSTAGWVAAAQRVLGRAWLVTPEGFYHPDEARVQASSPRRSSEASSIASRVPVVAKTAAKDLRRWYRASRFSIDPDGPWKGSRIEFVWQRHNLFADAGLTLASDLGVPAVVFLAATMVWEAEQWDVRRPGWSTLLERLGEQPALQAADVVCCGSELVAAQARRLGVRPDRILITPTGVDLEMFDVSTHRNELRQRLGIDDSFVIGWTGSFRRYHAVEQLIDAVAAIPGATLLLVGDGPERPRVRRYAEAAGVDAVFTGTVPHSRVPHYLAAMDAGVVLAAGDQEFHYSPLKLAEYLAAGLPVVVPSVPQLAARLEDGTDALLFGVGNGAELEASLRKLVEDPALCAGLSDRARALAHDDWSWDHQVRRVRDAVRALA